jgi:hypothetical protein
MLIELKNLVQNVHKIMVLNMYFMIILVLLELLQNEPTEATLMGHKVIVPPVEVLKI